jgi:hypothetical protein
VDHPAKGVGHPADLLLDQHLLEGAEPAPTELLGHVDGLEAELGDPAPVRLQQPVGQLAAGQLGRDLVGLELVGQGPGGRLDLPVGVRHRIALAHETDSPACNAEH